MKIKRIISFLSPTRTMAKTPDMEVVGHKYLPHLIVAVIALVGFYWLMGWELP